MLSSSHLVTSVFSEGHYWKWEGREDRSGNVLGAGDV